MSRDFFVARKVPFLVEYNKGQILLINKPKTMPKSKPKTKRAVKKSAKKVVRKVVAKVMPKASRCSECEEKLIGKITHYFSNIEVAVIDLISPIKRGRQN